MLRKSITGRNKYGNTRFFSEDGEKWDSKKEYNRWLFLKEAEKQGLISNIRRQVTYELIPSIKEEYIEHLKTKDKVKERMVQRPITYTADFVYTKDCKDIAEDVKASPNMAALDKAFLLKEKIFRWKFGYSIKRVYKPTDAI